MDLSNQTVLVTGAGGFIGSHLVEALLAKGCRVRALVKYNSRNDWGNLEQLPPESQAQLEIISGDITDPFLVRQAVKGCAAVFHLAALIGIPYSYVAPQHYVNVNVQGTLNVLEACRSEGVQKLVHTSTSETYGTALYTPIDEAHPLQGQSPYSASKIAADKMAESYYLSFDLPVATIRPFNTFGPRQSARAIIPTIISQALAYGKTRQPIKVGSLEPQRDFTFVKDTAQGFIRVAECEASVGQVINVGSGQTQTIGDTLNLILDILGQPDIPVITEAQRIRPEKSEVGLLLADNRKALELLNWQPHTHFRQGLTQTIEAIEASLGRYKTGIYNV
ncbi:SDR family NAD(P)-dependent oxidoreductase [Vampirovibrio chlorellavorus]|uniref:SDR family NAD(P)-dependent oxidoreductase n=1 Tax=Vampirovibrio chlorellavorus TaxID=758823 RepID=UPI0026EB0D1F|nr:SDR family NAD(P)-dependent oxidoreductase [Vampirovibrio chlorellavorus]